NPAVTLAFAMDGTIRWAMVPGYIICQILDGMVGGALVWLMYLAQWKATEDQGTKLAVFSTAPAIKNYFANFMSEIIGTGILTIGLLLIVLKKIFVCFN